MVRPKWLILSTLIPIAARVHRYPHSIVQDIASNPEFPSKNQQQRQNSLVAAQLFALKNAISNLRNAYNGLDVEWNDVGKCLLSRNSGIEWLVSTIC